MKRVNVGVVTRVMVRLQVRVTSCPAIRVIPVRVAPCSECAVRACGLRGTLVLISPQFQSARYCVRVKLREGPFNRAMAYYAGSSRGVEEGFPARRWCLRVYPSCCVVCFSAGFAAQEVSTAFVTGRVTPQP